jgi:hypothetical protein
MNFTNNSLIALTCLHNVVSLLELENAVVKVYVMKLVLFLLYKRVRYIPETYISTEYNFFGRLG